MSTTVNFDSLKYFEMFLQAGATEQYAKAHVNIMQEIVTQQNESILKDLATKQNLADLRQELKQDISDLRQELKQDISDLRQELKQDISDVRKEIAETKHETIKWFIGVALAQTALIVGIMAFMK